MSASVARAPSAPSAAKRIFLLSPANCGGVRAGQLLNPNATFELATRLREPDGAPIGEVFAFISGLYFRGKLTYSRAFTSNAVVITPSRGLLPIDTLVTLDVLREFATVDIDPANPRYREPLERDLARLAKTARKTEVVLLGSVASGKYVEILLDHIGDRLFFPETFVGRGDMSRGGVMLRAARQGEELTYIRASGAVRRGTRPPQLEPIARVTA
jgi:hypothetical protein